MLWCKDSPGMQRTEVEMNGDTWPQGLEKDTHGPQDTRGHECKSLTGLRSDQAASTMPSTAESTSAISVSSSSDSAPSARPSSGPTPARVRRRARPS